MAGDTVWDSAYTGAATVGGAALSFAALGGIPAPFNLVIGAAGLAATASGVGLTVIGSRRKAMTISDRTREVEQHREEAERANRELQTVQLRDRVGELLESLRLMLSISSANARLNVMTFVDDDGGSVLAGRTARFLRMEFASRFYGEKEKENRWERGMGVAGTAWAQGTAQLGYHPADKAAVEDLKSRLGTRLDFPDITEMKQLPEGVEQIKTVLSLPIYRPDSPDMIGVLNVDDRDHLPQSAIARDGTIDCLERIGDTVGRLLIRYKPDATVRMGWVMSEAG